MGDVKRFDLARRCIMKRTLTILMILSLTQPVWAGIDVDSTEYANGPSAATIGIAGRVNATAVPEWTDHNTHDPGVTLLEALRFAISRIHRALIRFGDGIRGRIPPD
jgi:hypothetical protein